MLFLCNYWLEFNKTLWKPYAYRAIMVFVLLLCNYWLELNETLISRRLYGNHQYEKEIACHDKFM
jgi:hypothetical protein